MDKEESNYEVKTVATQTEQVVFKGEKQYDIHELLAEIANILKDIRKELKE